MKKRLTGRFGGRAGGEEKDMSWSAGKNTEILE